VEEVFFYSHRFIIPCTKETTILTQTFRLWNIPNRQVFLLTIRTYGESTLFRKYYERGDLPIAVSFQGALRKVNK
jgi:hypothetical protein